IGSPPGRAGRGDVEGAGPRRYYGDPDGEVQRALVGQAFQPDLFGLGAQRVRVGSLTYEGASGHDVLYDVALDVGEAEVAPGVAEGQLLVVEAEQVQDGGVPVVDVYLALDGLVAVLVGGAVAVAALDAAAGHPEGEAAVVVVAPVGALGVGRPPE